MNSLPLRIASGGTDWIRTHRIHAPRYQEARDLLTDLDLHPVRALDQQRKARIHTAWYWCQDLRSTQGRGRWLVR